MYPNDFKVSTDSIVNFSGPQIRNLSILSFGCFLIQNLINDESGEPVDHPEVNELFGKMSDGKYQFVDRLN